MHELGNKTELHLDHHIGFHLAIEIRKEGRISLPTIPEQNFSKNWETKNASQ